MNKVRKALRELSKEDQIMLASMMLTIVNYIKDWAFNQVHNEESAKSTDRFMKQCLSMWAGLFETLQIPIDALNIAQNMIEEMSDKMAEDENKGKDPKVSDVQEIIKKHIIFGDLGKLHSLN